MADKLAACSVDWMVANLVEKLGQQWVGKKAALMVALTDDEMAARWAELTGGKLVAHLVASMAVQRAAEKVAWMVAWTAG